MSFPTRRRLHAFPGSGCAGRKEPKKHTKIPEDGLVFLFVGQLIRQKDLATILRALKLLREAGVCVLPCSLSARGKRGSIRWMPGQDIGLSRCVRFLGKILDREALQGIFARADLFIFPSVYDNAPVVTREAAAVATPSVMMSGRAMPPEGVEDGKNGLLLRRCAGKP
ncbi:MAG: glycosyltransferase [Candidatus Marinimicrobia bacterium]|nr:glycosyltransferase [Candidatus Neomarinimicrobiota bacterium]